MSDGMNRSEFLRTAARVGVFGALTGGAVMLLGRDARACPQPRDCAGCRAYVGCAIRLEQDESE